ncbi:MAG: hypothetical protein LBF88_05365 [Planctomycetaceae bacterium]|jgi:hypothetical protein|nr:hypothetical protein [Planctomycetaceae bacterium]
MKVDIPQNEQTGGMSRDQMLQQLVARLNRGEIDPETYLRIYAEIMSAVPIHSPPIISTSELQKQTIDIFQNDGVYAGAYVGGVIGGIAGVLVGVNIIAKIGGGIGYMIGCVIVGVIIGAIGSAIGGSVIVIVSPIVGAIVVMIISTTIGGVVGMIIGPIVGGNGIVGVIIGLGVGRMIVQCIHGEIEAKAKKRQNHGN